ncbi:putative fatty acyl-CoA reductase CG5065 [Zootermopsis nevadensis]|uniref:Fatty acyl-CoA reductase n=1 Tax=Zootermopsis nevadensis TaxID=136037 RepID=A0A067QNH3_ZOONE|nr:putative fatty acyl-CoA reductase CG5065 [Zootermopsis nevadensis]XP_021935112.1 putative fatty acyl-CoA reductase CG5065 [Zootermopsis nevadensis]XP_021935113.1 putative fatty acyl-CoA reductase CG5065 [Zootermopsis nevadensis]XP_021935114.1 putative fatty acyl-CoA reductase CG5065 [Zootermopsis nevadensis]XP_021935116.1 putative fatty acyl-CoA reductase CG5065 [Zootermopsis nevadensis]XP_021935117.1 putative fatty acyl-CoA reductase CG5065 [Zootermopsis nevadensis]KDR11037.1 Putative fat
MGTNKNNEAGGNSDNTNASIFNSPIQNFFSGSCILITGATGFVGKALVEKLLRSCPDLRTIYLLIRPKRGLDVQTRHKELLKNPVFDRIRMECPTAFKKIISVRGDVSEKDLGLCEEDKQRVVTEVNVVFHSAATVRFNESLKSAVILNTLGTQRVVQLCRDIHNLQAFVHVSTAYSNADKKEVLETVYPPPADPECVIQCCHTMTDDALEVVAQRLQGKHPNTYTLTKAMAEWVVAEQADDIPAAIVRPSIVTAAWREPVPGWVDNVSGITGIMMEIGRGTIRSIICDQKLTMDLIPVDFVVNTLIGVAWHTATYRPNTIRVYNCTTGSVNPITWKDFGILTQSHAREIPTRYVMWYPGFTFRTNHFVHKICELLFHFLPAFVADLLLRLHGAKPIMLKISKRFQQAAKTGEFFSLHEWKFHCDNVCALMCDAQDKTTFDVDVSQLDWDKYVKCYMLGIRKFILKDSNDTIPGARKKLQKLYWIHRFTQVLIVAFFLRIATLS